MKKGIKSLAAAALALSALTPVVASASTSVENGVYTTTNFYTLDQFKALTTAEKTGALTSSGAVVVIGGKVYEATDVLSATDAALPGLAKDAATYTTADGNKLESGKPLAPAPAGELKVESVSAINAKEVEVKFNKEVIASSVVPNAFTITKNNGTTVSIDATVGGTPIEVSEDGKSAKILLAAGLTSNDVLKVVVKKDIIVDKSYNKLQAQTLSNIVVTDNTAPKLLSAKHVGGTAVELTFDEQVDWSANTPAIKIDQTLVTTTVDATLNNADAGNYVYTVNAAAALSNGTHTVEVVNATDFATNVAATANKDLLQKATFAVTDDTTQVEVNSVTAEGTRTFLIKTSKPVVGATPANLTIKKGSTTFAQARYTVAPATDVDSTGKTLRVTFVADAGDANPLYASGETSTSLSVLFTGYKDGNNLVGKEYNGTVVLSTDKTAPTITSANLIGLDSTKNKIVVPFNETLSTVGADLTASKISVIKDGVKQTVTPAINGKKLELDFGSAVPDGEYTIILESGALKDVAGNGNAAVTVQHTVSEVATNAAIAVTFANATILNDKNIITATFAQKVTAATAATADSYLIDGAALPAGTLVTLDATGKIATIELPSTYKVDSDGISAKLAVKPSTVKVASGETDAGKYVSSSATEAKAVEGVVTLEDNVAPTLAKAEYVKNSAGLVEGIRLTFSEAVVAAAADANLTNDFVIKQGSSTLPYVVAAENAQDGTSDKVVYLKLDTTLTVASGTTVSLGKAADLTITDVSTNNKIANFTGVSVQ